MIQTNQQFNISASFLQKGIFYQVSEKKIRVVDSKKQMQYDFDCPEFDFKENMKHSKYMKDQQSIYSCQMYSSTVVGGHIYLQYYDCIYEFLYDRILFITKIPELPSNHWSDFCSKMFSIKNELYFSNCKKIYKLVKNQPVFVKDSTLNQFCQFANNVVAWIVYMDNKSEWVRVDSNLNRIKLFEVQYKINRFSFAQGGVAVFGNEQDNRFVIIDLVNMKPFVIESKEDWLAQTKIKDKLAISECGLSIADDDLKRLLGDQFVQQRNEMWNKYKQEQTRLYYQSGMFIDEAFAIIKGENVVDCVDVSAFRIRLNFVISNLNTDTDSDFRQLQKDIWYTIKVEEHNRATKLFYIIDAFMCLKSQQQNLNHLYQQIEMLKKEVSKKDIELCLKEVEIQQQKDKVLQMQKNFEEVQNILRDVYKTDQTK